jgi:hypothetical protein
MELETLTDVCLENIQLTCDARMCVWLQANALRQLRATDKKLLAHVSDTHASVVEGQLRLLTGARSQQEQPLSVAGEDETELQARLAELDMNAESDEAALTEQIQCSPSPGQKVSNLEELEKKKQMVREEYEYQRGQRVVKLAVQDAIKLHQARLMEINELSKASGNAGSSTSWCNEKNLQLLGQVADELDENNLIHIISALKLTDPTKEDDGDLWQHSALCNPSASLFSLTPTLCKSESISIHMQFVLTLIHADCNTVCYCCCICAEMPVW